MPATDSKALQNITEQFSQFHCLNNMLKLKYNI